MANPRPKKRLKVVNRVHIKGSPASTDASSQNAEFFHRAARWNLEDAYAQKANRKQSQAGENTRLPIKTAEGEVREVVNAAVDGIDPRESSEASEVESDLSTEGGTTVQYRSTVSARQAILDAKEELAKVASHICESPEDNVAGLKRLSRIGGSAHPAIQRLAFATQVTVYRDLIPGYPIRPLSDIEAHERLTKEVKQLRIFEKSLLAGYQQFLKDLAACAPNYLEDSDEATRGVASTAVFCACTLLLAVPHFNFRGELLNIIVGRLASRDALGDFHRCIDTLETLFRNDVDGTPSFDAVHVLAKFIKARRYQVDEAVLNTFLSLRLLSEFSTKASHITVDKPKITEAERKQGHKAKKEFRTKRMRKALKEQKKAENDFKEADAIVNVEHREKMQAETLKLVFGLYFAILKTKDSQLADGVLEGLSKYSHLINQEFFADILEVLRGITARLHPSQHLEMGEQDSEQSGQARQLFQDELRSYLLCINTAFSLLEGQGVVKSSITLGLDPTSFINSFYTSLYAFAMDPNIESLSLSTTDCGKEESPSLESRDPSHVRKGMKRDETTAALLVRALTSILTPHAISPLRLAAFAKQIFTSCVQLPERSNLALLNLLMKLAVAQKRQLAALWDTDETKSDGVFNPYSVDTERSNPFATSIWEGELLQHHFSPNVRGIVPEIRKRMTT